MTKIIKIADGAFFVPSYSEQTITRAYDESTTVQSFAFGDFTGQQPQKDEKKAGKDLDQNPLIGKDGSEAG
jgi:hypothetical protein